MRFAALPSARSVRSCSMSPSLTIFQNSAPSAGSVSGRLTLRTPGSSTSGPSSFLSAALRKSKTVCRPREPRNAASFSVAWARWPLRKSTPCRTRRPSMVGRPPTSRKLRTPVSSGSVDGTCCVTRAPPIRPPALLAEGPSFDDTTWVCRPMIDGDLSLVPRSRPPAARPGLRMQWLPNIGVGSVIPDRTEFGAWLISPSVNPCLRSRSSHRKVNHGPTWQTIRRVTTDQ